MFNITKVQEQHEKKLLGEWRVGPRTKVDVLLVPRYHPEVKNKAYAIEKQIRAKHGLVGRHAGDDLPPAAVEEMVERVYSEVIVRGWKGVAESENGEERDLEFSPAACKRVLKMSPAFMLDVSDVLEVISDERNEEQEAILGN
jgi:hypothetical protein